MSEQKWTLLLNDTHQVVRFTSEARLKAFAKFHGYAIRPSPSDAHAYYTVSVGYVPANGDKD